MGSYSPEDLNQKEYKKLIDETYKVFERAIADNDIPDRMRQALESDAFLFGGLKAHAQLSEAFSMIKDGKIKSWSEIEHEFDKLNDTYNRNWLQAEYNFAVNAAQQAANWANTDSDGRYNLQYRTALDEKVREQHQALEGITLPKENEFWDKFYPPNGWNCRCTVVEVRKSKYAESDAEEAMRKGEAATSQIGKDGKNRLEIFRFNPGKEEKLFPPEHPHRKVKGAEKAAKSLKKSWEIPDELQRHLDTNGIDLDERFLELIPENVRFRFGKSYYSPSLKHMSVGNYKDALQFKEVFYHEAAHAIDDFHSFYKSDKVNKLMARYISKYGNQGFKEMEKKINQFKPESREEYLGIGNIKDTLMSLSIRYGSGHTKSYFLAKGRFNRQKEFIAHSFENAYLGNPAFEKVWPELYNDMKTLVSELEKEIR